MAHAMHDTLVAAGPGTPGLFTAAAFSLPPLIGLQFLTAGLSLFVGLPWDIHGDLGGLIAVPILTLLGFALGAPRLRGFGWWAGVLTVLYGLQLALTAFGAVALAFHPFNAALLLTASLVILLKVQRRRAARERRDAVR